MCFLQHVGDVVELQPGGDVQRRLSVLHKRKGSSWRSAHFSDSERLCRHSGIHMCILNEILFH